MSSIFGLDQSSRIVFVGDGLRGLACNCRCIACDEPLIARQGSIREHHFAHASGRETCETNHESLLHRFAKQLIQEAGSITVPMDAGVANYLGIDVGGLSSVRLQLDEIEVEKAVGDLRPDLVGHTEHGVLIAIEVAYSSFCDMLKRDRFERLGLLALEIDLRAFGPVNFDPHAVRNALIHDIAGKAWLRPAHPSLPSERAKPTVAAASAIPASPKARLPEEVVTIAGRWVSIKQFPSGDLAVKVITYDPDVVSLVKSVAKANYGRYSAKWRSWNVPRWRAPALRAALRAKSQTISIVLQDVG